MKIFYLSLDLQWNKCWCCLHYWMINQMPRKEGNVLFNDTLNTFYLQLYGVGHMVRDHSDSERGNLMLPHGLLFLISSKGFYMHHPRPDSTYHSLCYTSRGALAGTRNSLVGPPWMIDLTTHCTISKRSYHEATSCSGMEGLHNWRYHLDHGCFPNYPS